MLRITHHRRFTANHTWHVDCANHQFFVKANPSHDEALAECAGHARLRAYYPAPRLYGARRIGRWTILTYDRWPHLGPDSGLLLDEITHADLTGDHRRLDACLTAILTHYQQVITRTLRRATNGETVSKLYGDRAAPDGRLDRYYQANAPWPIAIDRHRLRPTDLAATRLVVNGRGHALDFTALMTRLRVDFARHNPVWVAITQGDPTDINVGWSPAGGPIWFDYDTAGLNALPGEFACFLLYQRLHGAWLTPHYNIAAFRDRPSALTTTILAEPAVHIEHHRSSLVIQYLHTHPTPARRHVLRRYHNEIILPLASHLGINDPMDWLRPYLVMRLLAVYNLADLEPHDSALSLALLAEALDPTTRLPDFLALTPTRTEVNQPWLAPLPSSPEPVPASAQPSPNASPSATT